VLSYLLIKKDGEDPPPNPEYNVKDALGLTSFQFAIVTGSVYTFTNGFANLFFGYFADIYPRKWLWLTTCFGWTLLTFTESLTQNFVQLLFARIGFAILMGSCVPLSVSLLSDFTLPKERGVA